MSRILIVAILILSLGACASIERVALPKPVLLSESFSVGTAEQTRRLNYTTYDRFLAKYWVQDTTGIARLKYSAVSEADQASLVKFVSGLQSIDPGQLKRDEQLAFWINLYNAQTIRLILENYPVDSIRDIKDGPFSIGPWDRKVVAINGTTLSLNDIEHRIIRPAFQEPRIHYALNCAAVSCPNLAPKAWRGAGLEEALEAAERSYLADPRGVNIGEDGRVTASKIYVWFKEDFGSNNREVVARLISKAPEPKRTALAARGRIDRFEYDWALNEIR